jgi:large subunit ribosomal protein L25
MELKAVKRTALGKGLKALRLAGKIPGVVYGAGEEAMSIELSIKDFEQAYKESGESSVITLDIDGSKKSVLIQEVAIDPVLNYPIHADFYAIKKGQKVEVEVPIEFVGESPAVKEGANLVKVLHALTIEGEATHLPHEINIDVSSIAQVGDSITAGDIRLPAGITLVTKAEEMIVLAAAQVEETEEISEAPDMSQIGISEERGKKEEEAPTE